MATHLRTITKRQAAAVAKLTTAMESVAQIERMLERAKRDQNKAVYGAVTAGVSKAETARILGVVHGRVWQIVDAHEKELEAAAERRSARRPRSVESDAAEAV